MTVFYYTRPSVVTWRQPSGVTQTETSQLLDYMQDDVSNRSKNPIDSKGWRAPSRYSRTVNHNANLYSLNGTYIDSNDNVYTRTGAANGGGGYAKALPPLPQYMRDRCIQQALTKLKNSEFNAAQSVGERKQLAKMTRSNLDRMRQDVEGAPGRRQFRNIKNLSAKDLHSLWLEFQYGWRPLMSDIHGATKELVDRENKDNEYFCTVIASASEKFFERYTVTEGYGLNWQITHYFSGRHHCKVRLDYVKKNAPLVAFSSLGLTNPLLLAWELLPWSFVADWFLPVGNYLNVLDADYGWSFKGGTLSRITRGSNKAISAKLSPSHPPSVLKSGYLTPEGKSYQMNFTREVFSTSPLPRMPRFNSSSNGEHVLNGIALFRIALSKLF